LSLDEDTVIQKKQSGGTAAAGKKRTNSIVPVAPQSRFTVRVKACEPKKLGEHLPPCVAIIRNLGPSAISVISGYEDIDAVVFSGAKRLILVRDYVGLAIIGISGAATLKIELLCGLADC
jgi:hypothetical protein